MQQVRCQWKEAKLHRDEPDKGWQPGTLLQFIFDGGFVQGVIATEAGTLRHIHIDLIHIPWCGNE